jgi:hypothetical protein
VMSLLNRQPPGRDRRDIHRLWGVR